MEYPMLQVPRALTPLKPFLTAGRMLFALVFLGSFLCSHSSGQELSKRLTNQDIIEMTALGLSDDVIIAKIRSVAGSEGLKFDTSVEGLKSLKTAKVSDAVIKVKKLVRRPELGRSGIRAWRLST
jgi:hypothetical protein